MVTGSCPAPARAPEGGAAPSGGVEPREDLCTALDRGLRERWGYEARTFGDAFLVTFYDVSGTPGRARQLTVAVVRVRRQVRLSGEHSDLRWVSETQAACADATDDTRGVLDGWFAGRHS